MKLKTTLAAALASLTLVSAVPALADRIDDRQAMQRYRIEEGLRTGQLSRSEYNFLMEQQREIARIERKMERDGTLTRAERIRLNQLQNHASWRIFWEKHDRETRNYGGDHRGWGRARGWGYGRDYGYGYGHDGYDRPYPRRWWQWHN